jgi:hypothetical protein
LPWDKNATAGIIGGVFSSLQASIPVGWCGARRSATKQSPSDLMNFLSELKRRNVYKVAVAYAVVDG